MFFASSSLKRHQ